MLRIILLAISLMLPQVAAFAAGEQPPSKGDGHGDRHGCEHRQQQQTS